MSFPTNLSDAISAALDGLLGTFEEVKIGDLTVSALIENDAPKSLNITRRTTEDGYNVVHAAVEQPQELTWLICLANPNYSVDALLQAGFTGDISSLTETWRDKKQTLLTMQSTREVFSAQSQEQVYENMMIESIEPVYNVEQNWDAYFCYVRMVEYKTVVSGVGGLLDSIEVSLGDL